MSMMIAKYWPAHAWSAPRRMFSMNKRSNARTTATDTLSTILASCPPREAGAPPSQKTRSDGSDMYAQIQLEIAKRTIDLSGLSQETKLFENAPLSRPKSPMDGANILIPKATKPSPSSEPVTGPSASFSTPPVLRTDQSPVPKGGQPPGTSFDVMAAWNDFVVPAATPDSIVTEHEFVQVTKGICNSMPEAGAFLSITRHIVASIQNSSNIDIELSDMDNATNQLHSSPENQLLDLGERLVKQGTVLPPSSPIPARPLPLPPTTCSTNHALHNERCDRQAQAGTSISQDPTPQPPIIPYPPLRLNQDTRTRALLEHIRGFKEICEELDYASDTDEMLNELKWSLRVDPTTVDFGTKQFQAFDPQVLDAVPEPVHIGNRWAQAVDVMTELNIRIRRFSEGARDCIAEVHTENFLLKRRVCEMEAAVDGLPGEVQELRETVKNLQSKLDMVLNSGMHNVTSTRMADKSLDRVSKAMKQTAPENKSKMLSRLREQTPYLPRVRKPLGEISSPTQAIQPSTLRRPVYHGWKRNQNYTSPVRPSASIDENVEDDLMAAWELQSITRAVKPAPLRILKVSEDTEKDVSHRGTEHEENLTASGKAILDPADEAVFDNDSQIW